MSRQWPTKVRIRLYGYAGWSASLLFAYCINRLSHNVADIWAQQNPQEEQGFSLGTSRIANKPMLFHMNNEGVMDQQANLSLHCTQMSQFMRLWYLIWNKALPSEQTHTVTRKSYNIITDNRCIACQCWYPFYIYIFPLLSPTLPSTSYIHPLPFPPLPKATIPYSTLPFPTLTTPPLPYTTTAYLLSTPHPSPPLHSSSLSYPTLSYTILSIPRTPSPPLPYHTPSLPYHTLSPTLSSTPLPSPRLPSPPLPALP